MTILSNQNNAIVGVPILETPVNYRKKNKLLYQF